MHQTHAPKQTTNTITLETEHKSRIGHAAYALLTKRSKRHNTDRTKYRRRDRNNRAGC